MLTKFQDSPASLWFHHSRSDVTVFSLLLTFFILFKRIINFPVVGAGVLMKPLHRPKGVSLLNSQGWYGLKMFKKWYGLKMFINNRFSDQTGTLSLTSCPLPLVYQHRKQKGTILTGRSNTEFVTTSNSPADKQGLQKRCMSGSTTVSVLLLKYLCPERGWSGGWVGVLGVVGWMTWPSALAFSLSLHRHSYLRILCCSLFISP